MSHTSNLRNNHIWQYQVNSNNIDEKEDWSVRTLCYNACGVHFLYFLFCLSDKQWLPKVWLFPYLASWVVLVLLFWASLPISGTFQPLCLAPPDFTKHLSFLLLFQPCKWVWLSVDVFDLHWLSHESVWQPEWDNSVWNTCISLPVLDAELQPAHLCSVGWAGPGQVLKHRAGCN